MQPVSCNSGSVATQIYFEKSLKKAPVKETSCSHLAILLIPIEDVGKAAAAVNEVPEDGEKNDSPI